MGSAWVFAAAFCFTDQAFFVMPLISPGKTSATTLHLFCG